MISQLQTNNEEVSQYKWFTQLHQNLLVIKQFDIAPVSSTVALNILFKHSKSSKYIIYINTNSCLSLKHILILTFDLPHGMPKIVSTNGLAGILLLNLCFPPEQLSLDKISQSILISDQGCISSSMRVRQKSYQLHD